MLTSIITFLVTTDAGNLILGGAASLIGALWHRGQKKKRTAAEEAAARAEEEAAKAKRREILAFVRQKVFPAVEGWALATGAVSEAKWKKYIALANAALIAMGELPLTASEEGHEHAWVDLDAKAAKLKNGVPKPLPPAP